MHYLSRREAGPFIPINCGAIPDALLGSEFFGHSRGAFTDAREAHEGLIAQANTGTLFLDELETLSARGQVALLRFLQDHEYRPLGAQRACRADVRVIAATNADLGEMASRGEFRRDLLYRLNGLVVAVPPLREREGDAVILARAFLQRLCAQYDRPRRSLHPRAERALSGHEWAGNVRELENLVHREFLLNDEPQLQFEILSDSERRVAPTAGEAPERSNPASPCVSHPLTSVGFREAKARVIAEFERAYVCELLTRANGNVSLAARLSGKDRSRLGRLLRKHHVCAGHFKREPREEASSA
jgi:two-component system response regulator GlrR